MGGELSTRRQGRFITFEGGEGAGKSTQIQRLAAWLGDRNIACLTTREPGGTEGAEAIRALLVEGGTDRWLPLTEALLHTAARHDHTERVITPALKRGLWVLSDRYVDSTRVYQGIAAGVGVERIDALHAHILGDVRPDLTLLLDMPVATGLARRVAAGSGGRHERMGTDFHEKVRRGFQRLARDEPGRIALIDATGDVADVDARVRAVVASRIVAWPAIKESGRG